MFERELRGAGVAPLLTSNVAAPTGTRTPKIGRATTLYYGGGKPGQGVPFDNDEAIATNWHQEIDSSVTTNTRVEFAGMGPLAV